MLKPIKLTSVFDIETSALPKESLDQIKPEFVANKTLKDPEKIRADLESKEAEWVERAALDATTGKVLCIGMLADDMTDVTDAPEAETIERFWNWLELRLARSENVIGFCIFHFDLPFLIRRSWALNLDVPRIVRRGRYWHDNLIDLHDVWKCGNYDQRASLDVISKTLGVGEKNGNGAEFAALWKSDKARAIEYVKNDLMLTRKCADRMLS